MASLNYYETKHNNTKRVTPGKSAYYNTFLDYEKYT